jgi:hypothetical protein
LSQLFISGLAELSESVDAGALAILHLTVQIAERPIGLEIGVEFRPGDLVGAGELNGAWRERTSD